MTVDLDPFQVSPQKENICAVVVSYFPEGDFLSRLRLIQPQVGHLVVVDNATTGDKAYFLSTIDSQLGATVICNSKNLGIATALNQGAHWASERGYKWLLTFDQDTIVDADMVRSLVEVYCACGFSDRLAVVGSNFLQSPGNRPIEDFHSDSNPLYKEVKTVITSGSLTSLPVFQRMGGFRDDFFLDCVDLEYCLRGRANGYRVIITRKTLMAHPIGCASEHRLPWKKTYTTNHAPFRQYFMTRNTLIMARNYILQEPQWITRVLWMRAKSLLGICLFEKDVRAKLRFFALGFFDGISGKTGRFA
jgi:rhamnosyltransferase